MTGAFFGLLGFDVFAVALAAVLAAAGLLTVTVRRPRRQQGAINGNRA